LRSRHHAKAAKEENDNAYKIRQSGYQASVRKADADDDQRADKAKPNRRFEEERFHGPAQS